MAMRLHHRDLGKYHPDYKGWVVNDVRIDSEEDYGYVIWDYAIGVYGVGETQKAAMKDWAAEFVKRCKVEPPESEVWQHVRRPGDGGVCATAEHLREAGDTG